MSGWLINTSVEFTSSGMQNAFEEKFELTDAPKLSVEIEEQKGLKFLKWMWKENPNWADLDFFHDKNKGVVVILDGYITGCGTLSSDLNSNSENFLEKLYALWEDHGTQLIKGLNGSFSIVIHNLNNAETTVVTDRWCSRPVWFVNDLDGFSFGNNTAAVAAIYSNNLTLDKAAVWSLLATNRPVLDRSIYNEIRRIGASSVARFSKNSLLKIDLWYELKFVPDNELNLEKWGEKISELLQQSAERLTNIFPNPNLFLSGGMDSRVAIAALGANINSVTLTTQPNMNSKTAQRVADEVGSNHELIIRDDNWYLDRLNCAALIAGGNYNIHHAHFIKCVERTEEEEGTCFVLGDLLENFNKHYYRIEEKEISEITSDKIVDEYAQLYAYSHKNWNEFEHLLNPKIAQDCRKSWSEKMREHSENCLKMSDDKRDAIDALFRWTDGFLCPTNLMLECIKPFSSHANLMHDIDLFDALLSIPADLKSSGKLHNKILNQLNKKLLKIPNSNFWLSPNAPSYLNKITKTIKPVLGKIRRKVIRHQRNNEGPVTKTDGSWHMLNEWYAHDKAHRDFIYNVLTDDKALPEEIFNHTAIKKSWVAFAEGDTSKGFELYGLLSFGLLHRQIPASELM